MKTGNTTDALLERALCGEEQAFGELFERFGARLRHYISDRMGPRLASQMEPDDLVQEVFGEVFTHIQRFDPRGKGTFYKLLVTIVNRRLINLERNLAVRPEGHLAPGGGDLLVEGEGRGLASPATGPRHSSASAVTSRPFAANGSGGSVPPRKNGSDVNASASLI
jgi:DNA-directed RNA polymerase specialized sigma24 family protein